MKRRTVLAGTSLAAVGFSGCFGSSDDPNGNDSNGGGQNGGIEYERCENRIIEGRNLPDLVQEEMSNPEDETTPLAGGKEYGPDEEPRITQVMDVDSSYIRSFTDEVTVFYEVTFEEEGDVKRLQLNDVVPEYDEPIVVRNETTDELTIDIRVDGGDVSIDETTQIEADREIEFDDEFDYLAHYTAEIEIDELGIEIEESWNVDTGDGGHPTFVLEDGEYRIEERDKTDTEECEWNVAGGLDAGYGSS